MNLLHHSAAVHIPLALAILFPLAYFTIALSLMTGWLPRRTWVLLMGLVGVQWVTLGLAYKTGTRDGLFSEASTELVNQHQQLAENFSLLWLMIGVVVPLAFLLPRRWPVLCHIVLLILMAIQLTWAVQLGRAGGKLVFGK